MAKRQPKKQAQVRTWNANARRSTRMRDQASQGQQRAGRGQGNADSRQPSGQEGDKK